MAEEEQQHPLHEEHFGTPTEPKEAPRFARELFDQGSHETDETGAQVQPPSAERQAIDALSVEERAAIELSSEKYQWDQFNREEVVHGRAGIEDVMKGITAVIGETGATSSAVFMLRMNQVRERATTTVLERMAPLPVELAEDADEAAHAAHQAAVAKHDALRSMMTMNVADFDTSIKDWATRDKLRLVQERSDMHEEALRHEEALKGGEQSVQAAETMAKLNEKHGGLMGRIDQLPMRWDDLKKVINPEGGDGFDQAFEAYATGADYTAALERAKEWFPDEQEAAQFTRELFAQQYISDKLRVRLSLGEPAIDVEAARDDLMTMMLNQEARADQDTYAKASWHHQNYAEAPAPEPAPAEQSDGAAAPVDSAEITRDLTPDVQRHKRRIRDRWIGKLFTSRNFRGLPPK